ncbi:hypothetical protein BV898_06030 [Hypsibius exemplaris]|uniref:Uncharacterized protein n=1 Tax=Hypsibius exemplaris TaxID=2072580 RepID=A0A1W0WXU0_HYPEX|nr:hypothetical protein BV898_06030 [Hypsibius exemplaris]
MQRVSRSCLLAVMMLLLGFTRAIADNLQIPHPKCRNAFHNVGGQASVALECKIQAESYVIPDNFNVSRIRPDIVHLEVTYGILRNEEGTYIPTIPSLLSVRLEQFNNPDTSPRFPMGRFFEHLKAHLTTIIMVSVKLLHFEHDDLAGFPRLKILRLEDVYISVLDKFMFQSLVPNGSPSMLSDLQISFGAIKTMDWSFLRPIAGSLEKLRLDRLQLAANRWNCSEETFKLKRTSTVSLSYNSLQAIPRCFLDSLSATALKSLYLQSSLTAFCADSDKCDCCELNSLAFWVRNAGLPGVTRSITCGAKMNTFNKFPAQLNFPTDCPGSGTTTKSPTSNVAPFTQPSGGHSVANASVDVELHTSTAIVVSSQSTVTTSSYPTPDQLATLSTATLTSEGNTPASPTEPWKPSVSTRGISSSFSFAAEWISSQVTGTWTAKTDQTMFPLLEGTFTASSDLSDSTFSRNSFQPAATLPCLKKKYEGLNLSTTRRLQIRFVEQILDHYGHNRRNLLPPLAPKKQTVKELGQSIGLDTAAIKDLKANGFRFTDDLQNVIPSDLNEAVKLLRDKAALRTFFFTKPEHTTVVLPESPAVDDLHHKICPSRQNSCYHDRQGRHRPHRSRSSSRDNNRSSGESLAEFKFFKTLPVIARDLPRPHIFVYANAFLANRVQSSKLKFLQLEIQEFLSGYMEHAKTWFNSPRHSTILVKLMDYVNFLTVYQHDYAVEALMAFDDVFRNYAILHGCGFNDDRSRIQVITSRLLSSPGRTASRRTVKTASHHFQAREF